MKICPICKKEIENHHAYSGHISGHARRGEKYVKEIKRYICVDCNFEFQNGNQLRGHNRRLHKNNKFSLEEKIQKYQEYLEKNSTPIICYKLPDHIYDDTIQYWVYCHYTDENEIFYVGIGPMHRAYSLQDRSQHHKDVREQYGMNVGILWGPTNSRQEVLIKERELIAKYHTHTRDPLAVKHATNHSIGGEHGGLGARWKLTGEKLEAQRRRNNDPIIKAKRGAKIKGRIPWNKGKKMPKEFCEKIKNYNLYVRTPETKQKTSISVNRTILGKKLLSFYEPGTLWNN